MLRAREGFDADPAASSARESLSSHLIRVLDQLEPGCLGLYWPMRREFDAPAALAGHARRMNWPLALPFTRRSPREMDYRRWDGQPPSLVDGCSIPSASGAVVVPDVVLAPCVGFTDDGFRLGYGGGYFDRFLAAHPHVTAVGVAFSFMRIAPEDYQAEPHDRALAFIVTEHGVHQG